MRIVCLRISLWQCMNKAGQYTRTHHQRDEQLSISRVRLAGRALQKSSLLRVPLLSQDVLMWVASLSA